MDSSTRRWLLAFALPGALVAVVIGVFAALFGFGWWSVLIGLVGSMIIGAILYWQAEAITARSMGGAEQTGPLHPRLENQLESLCAVAGVAEPTVYMVNSDRADAAVFGTSEMRSNLAVTNGLLNTLSVVQLEGVLARELARVRSADMRWDTLAVAMIRLPLQPFGSFGRELVQWARGTDISVQDDLAGVELTRYPPGLSEALQVMEKSADGSPIRSITSHLWVIGNAAGAVEQPGLWSIDDRIEVLRDLA